MKHHRSISQLGFTLIELITVMIMIGIMAVVALPRFSSIGSFDAMGVADQMAAYLRYAQKSALAGRRNVTITITNASTAPTMVIGAACNAGSTLIYPVTFKTPTSTVTIEGASFPLTICFDTLGGITSTTTLTFKDNTNALIRTITIEGTTGYVQAS